jgi:hypothetical protein
MQAVFVGRATDASGAPKNWPVKGQQLYFMEGLINNPFTGHGL